MLARGSRLVEILKQDQYSPFPLEKQVLIIYAAINGFVDDYDESVLLRYEAELNDFVAAHYSSVMDELREKCPWDQKQTIETLRSLTIEETYELSEAILEKDMDAIKKEVKRLIISVILIDSKNFYWANSFNKGVNLFQRGNKTADEDSAKVFYDKSIDAFETAAIIQPDSADTYKNMAFVYMSSGRNELAIEPLQKLVDLKKELDGYRYLGEIYYTIGTSKSAEYSVSGNTIDSLEAAEYYDKAILVLEDGVAIYKTDGELTRILNSSYIETGRIEEALESSKVLVEAEPDNETYRYNYGVILLQTDDYPGAEEQFLKALEINPDYENAAYNLGLTYVKWGTQLKEQEEEKEVYTDEDIEKYRQALPYLELIVESDAENAEIWELLGKVYSILSMQEEAMDAFNKADQLR